VPQELWAIATQIGIVGAFLLAAALLLLHQGVWFPKRTVDGLIEDLRSARVELAAERKQHREDVGVWEQRTFNALGVADRLTRSVEEERVAASRASRNRV
jgi:hypothetical protein